MERLKMQSQNVIGSNIQKIAQLFPQCVTERLGKDGKPELGIDFEKLQAELSDEVIGEGEERYQFTWPDKRAAARLANIPTTMTLRPCREESVDFDHTQNLYIEGDNLDVLKVLRETYLGKVKMIYIDPPYNTGNDFVYNDDFTESYEEFAESCKVRDEEGNLQFNPKANGESNGRFHTDWLNMMYPRLKVARDLLTEDGVIFISIDDNEVENLRKICDEVFGESNYIGDIVIQSNPRGSMSSSELASLHEYLLLYAKNKGKTAIVGHKLSFEMLSEYKYQDENGPYRLIGLRMRGGFWRRSDRPNLYFPIFVDPNTEAISITQDFVYSIPVYPIQTTTGEEGTWRWSKDKILKELSILRAKKINRNGNLEWDIYQKDYLKRGIERRTKAKSIWIDSDMNYQNGTITLKELLGSSQVFDYSKPIGLLSKSIEMIDSKDSIVLDFFSGSATTAHAVMQLNAEDGGNRKFIMVQLPELTDEKSEAYKAGYKNICEIGKERIRRAGKKIKADSPLTTQNLDTGFRVLKLDSSNMLDVYYIPEEFNEKMIFQENVKVDRTDEDLLFQVMLELGIELSASIRQERLGPQRATVFNVDDGYLMATFEQEIDEATITEIAKRNPGFFVMRDASAASDNVLDNFEQLFRHYSPETSCRII